MQHPVPPPPPLSGPYSSAASFHRALTGQIDWKAFLRIVIVLAPVVGFFSLAFAPAAWLILLPGSTLLAIHLYRRRRPGPLTGLQGAKLGAFTGLMSFAFFAIFLGTFVAFDYGRYRQVIETALASNPPAAEQLAQSLPPGANVVALLTATLVVFTLMILLIVGAISGALAASVARDRFNP